MALTEDQTNFIKIHLDDVREHITQAAKSECESTGKLEAQKLLAIASEYARTQPIPPSTPQSNWSAITTVLIGVPGIIWISALLAVSFGALSAIYPGSASLSDLAKVFAGAIVGASGVRK